MFELGVDFQSNTWLQLGESVAIKIIDKAKLNKEGLQQLRIEIRLWSRLSEHEHQNVVKLYQVIDTRTKLYLVMGESINLYDILITERSMAQNIAAQK